MRWRARTIVQYAGLNADGSTTSFSGATGSHTIAAVGGGDFFNHAAVGGDDVNTPTKKHKGAFYY
jgi:uncharacterized protein (DUF2237 family)